MIYRFPLKDFQVQFGLFLFVAVFLICPIPLNPQMAILFLDLYNPWQFYKPHHQKFFRQ